MAFPAPFLLRGSALPLALLVACAAAQSAQATTIFRCEAQDGVATYSDQPCASLGASEVLPPLEAAASGALRSSATVPVAVGAEAQLDALCPAPTVQELPAAVGRAFAADDVNALASLYHWSGLTQGDAGRIFPRFRTLLAQPLRHVGLASGSALVPASVGSAAMTATSPAAGNPQLWLSVGTAQAPQQVRFQVVRNAGCVWLRFG